VTFYAVLYCRAVAQFFKDHIPFTSSDEHGKFSLNGILEGRTRKQAARMFFETTVMFIITASSIFSLHSVPIYAAAGNLSWVHIGFIFFFLPTGSEEL
jgi:hypothetical protein